MLRIVIGCSLCLALSGCGPERHAEPRWKSERLALSPAGEWIDGHFVRSEVQALEQPFPEKSGWYGWSVSLRADGAIVGGSHTVIDANGGEGAAFVFTHDGTTWTFEQMLTCSAPELQAGGAVAIDGDTAFTGTEA